MWAKPIALQGIATAAAARLATHIDGPCGVIPLRPRATDAAPTIAVSTGAPNVASAHLRSAGTGERAQTECKFHVTGTHTSRIK